MNGTVDTLLKALLLILLIHLTHSLPGLEYPGKLLLPATVFLLFYSPLSLAYRKWIRGRISREASLEGAWVYLIHDDIFNMKRYGTFTLRESARGLEAVNGSSWHYGTPPKPGNRQSVWNSTAVSRKGRRLSLVYDINIIRPLKENKPRKTTGAMDLSLKPRGVGEPGAPPRGEGTVFTGTNSMGRIEALRAGKKIGHGEIPLVLEREFGVNVLATREAVTVPMGRVIYLEEILTLNRAH